MSLRCRLQRAPTSVAGTLPVLSHLNAGAPPYAHFAGSGPPRQATPGTVGFSRRKPLWLRDHSLRSRAVHLHGCTPTQYAQQQGGPALFSNYHHLYQSCCRPAGGGKSGGPPAALPPCTPAASSRDFRSRYPGTDGLLWLARLTFLAPRGGPDPGWPRHWPSTRSKVYAFFVLGTHYRYAAGGPRALPEVLCRVGETLTDRTHRCIFAAVEARVLYAFSGAFHSGARRQRKAGSKRGGGLRAEDGVWTAPRQHFGRLRGLPQLRSGPQNPLWLSFFLYASQFAYFLG